MAVKDIPTLPGYGGIVPKVALVCLVKILFCITLRVLDTEKIWGLCAQSYHSLIFKTSTCV